MSCLSKLRLSETAIKDPSLLVERSTGLIDLDLRDCKNLSSLPIAICSLTSLKTLNISDCSKLDKLPENLGNIEGLEELDGSRTAIKELPSSMVLLKISKISLSVDVIFYHLNHQINSSIFLIPGSRILKWFSYQSEGASLNLQEPPSFIGIALCIVFVLCEHYPLQHPPESSKNHPVTHFINFSVMSMDIKFQIT